MKKSRTIKRDFYSLVLKIFIYTFISTVVAYIGLFLYISLNTSNKEANYYEKYINNIENQIIKNQQDILKGNLIELEDYSKEIKGEVIDINGNHIYGEMGIANHKINILKAINKDTVIDNHIYRYISLTENNTIKAIYVIRAPFGYIINNLKVNPAAVVFYIIVLFSPLIFFILYLFIFTSKLYKYLLRNVNILLSGAEKISQGNFNFQIQGVNGEEFNKIQQSFNTMVSVLSTSIKNLSNLDEERRMMVSSIAHDIRTPITVIKGQIEIVEDLREMSEFNIKSHLEIVNNNCDKMITLTDNLSLLYKVEGEGFIFRKNKVDLCKVLKDKEIEISSLADKKDINISFQVNLSKKYYILDELMLIRVLNNILYNSLRFTKEGQIKLIVDDNIMKEKIYFKCFDTGVGFKQKDTSKLFTAFYQDKDYKNHFGLGLYISKRIISNYNGEIKAYNNELGGATIEFYIKEL